MQLKFFKIDFIIFVYFYHVYVLLVGFFLKIEIIFLYMNHVVVNHFFHFRFIIIYLLIFVRLKQSDRILSDVKLLVYCNISYHIDLLMITYDNK